ncbi:unnamed protein product [Gadus morhua 'NCC']
MHYEEMGFCIPAVDKAQPGFRPDVTRNPDASETAQCRDAGKAWAGLGTPPDQESAELGGPPRLAADPRRKGRVSEGSGSGARRRCRCCHIPSLTPRLTARSPKSSTLNQARSARQQRPLA